MKALLLALLLFIAFGLTAQTERVTCHQTHRHIKAPKLTPQQKSLLQQSNQRSDTFNILNYEIHIDLTDYDGQTIKGVTLIDIVALMDGVNTVTLDLLQMNIDSVTIDGVDAVFSYDDAQLVVELPAATTVDDAFQIAVGYEGSPYQDPQWGGFYFESNIVYNLGIGLSTIPPNFGKVWYPCFDSFRERATYDFYILADDGHRPIGQGMLMWENQLEGDSIEAYYRMPIPLPTYLTSVTASNYVTTSYTHEGVFGPVPVELHAREGQVDDMNDRFVNLGAAIDAFEYWYGPYIWNKVGYVQTTVGAMEHATHIAYPQFMNTVGIRSNEELFSHELGHLWWGDIVSPALHNHMWIKEGNAEYCQHLMREWLEGREEFIEDVKDNQLLVLDAAHLNDEGYFPLSPIPDEVIYGTHSYNKGAAQMHTMRGYMGDSLFRAAQTAVLDSFYLSDMGPEQYASALSNSVGMDMQPFFDAHIYSPGFASYVIDSMSTVPLGGEYETTVYVQQKLRAASDMHEQVPLEITLLDEAWEKQSQRTLVSGQFTEVTVMSDFEPLMVMLDGEYKLNKARMDYDAVLTSTTPTVTLPWVDLRLRVEEIEDSAYFRSEHHWVAPDVQLVDDNIIEISSTHYWTIGGLWSEGLFLQGRASFNGVNENELDYDLVGDTEDAIGMVYRTDPSDSWSIYPYYSLQIGGNNGTGLIRLDSLIAGEYAFANVDSSVDIEEIEGEFTQFEIFPNPAVDELFVTTEMPGNYVISVYDGLGKLVLQEDRFLQRQGNKHIDASALKPGRYTLLVSSENGRFTEQHPFVKM